MDKGRRCNAQGCAGIRQCMWAAVKWSTAWSKGDCLGSDWSAASVEHTHVVAAGMARHVSLANGPQASPNQTWAYTLEVGRSRLNLFNYSKDF
jgi:hypothetical protein